MTNLDVYSDPAFGFYIFDRIRLDTVIGGDHDKREITLFFTIKFLL